MKISFDQFFPPSSQWYYIIQFRRYEKNSNDSLKFIFRNSIPSLNSYLWYLKKKKKKYLELHSS